MTETNTCPAAELAAGDVLHGFQVLRVEPIVSMRLVAYEMEHLKTGAKVLHLHAFDRENLYAIGFRTPPADSTGLPHILEHSVLAGSQTYPLKDVFKELMRSSMQTFINAFTYPDKTVYPVASQIPADFYNLARVYTDLVFHPRMLPETFMQEGHHLEPAEIDNLQSDLIRSGIVYNEMKGVYSSPESLMYKALQENLYPDTVYAFDSGGDPNVIPKLTYEQFCDYHRRYYSPANARFFLYGDIPTKQHLAFLAEMLAGFDRVSVNSTINPQPAFDAPRQAHGFFPADPEEPLEKKTTVTVAWGLAENRDFDTALLLEIISSLLVGSSAGPLRKALIDSGLGEDLSPASGIEADLRQLMFCAGLRNVQTKDADKIERLIFDTLEKVVTDGFDPELIEGVLHQVEFHGKEISRGSYPYGIALMGHVFQTWLYDGDPLIGLDFARVIETIRSGWSADPAMFQKAVQKWLIDNPHRVVSVMEPDADFNRRIEDEEKRQMAEIKKALSEAQLAAINEQAKKLKAFQTEPDPPEAAACLPKLRLSDIPREVDIIPTQAASIDGVSALKHDIFTNGIVNVDLAFDVGHVPEELQIYLPLLGKLMCGMGAGGYSYDDMSKRISLTMGGFGYDLAAGLTVHADGAWQKMIFSFKALYRNMAAAVDIAGDILCAGDLSAEARMRDLIAERKNSLQSAVVPSGHIFAKRAAGAGLSLPAYRDELWHGRTQFGFVKRQAGDFDELKTDLRGKMDALKALIFTRANLLINLTADAQGLALAEEQLARLLRRLPAGGNMAPHPQPELRPGRAGIAVPTQVSYVASVFKAPAYTDPAAAILMLASKELSNSYLYKHIRVQGGAYGGMSAFDFSMGLMAFLSYRDPHIVRTLDVFSAAAKFYAENELSLDDLEKAAISTLSALDRPQDPAGRGYVAMIRSFAGATDAMRQTFRDTVMSATPEKVRRTLAEYFARAASSQAVAVYSAREKLVQANEALPEKLDLENLI